MEYTFDKRLQLQDRVTGFYFNVIRVEIADGTVKSIAVPRELSGLPAYKYLLMRGVNMPPYRDFRDRLDAVLADDAPTRFRASHAGYEPDGQSFVCHRVVEGDVKGTLLPPSPQTLGRFVCLNRSGTLEEWQHAMEPAKYSTAATVALFAAFAAYLLTPLGRSSFGLIFFGGSRGGKTTAQLLAGSVIGFGIEEELPTMNCTAAGLLEMAQLIFRDHILLLNEIGTTRGSKNTIHEAIRNVTYALTTGSDTQRHSAWTGTNAVPRTFKVLALLSSERSPEEWAEKGGELREAGETARLIALPVVENGQTIFDRAPADRSMPAWDAQQFGHLRHTVAHHHGVAGPVFVERFLSDQDTYLGNAEEDIALFEAEMASLATTPIARDIVSKFGVIYAGGIAAIDAAVLLFDRQSALDILVDACSMAFGALPDAALDLRRDLLHLKERLQDGGIVDGDHLSAAEKRLLRQADGFYRRDGIGWLYVVRATTFATWFRSAPRLRGALDWMDEGGLLRHQRARAAGASNEWAQSQITWPDGSRVRSICIYISDTLDVFDIEA